MTKLKEHDSASPTLLPLAPSSRHKKRESMTHTFGLDHFTAAIECAIVEELAIRTRLLFLDTSLHEIKLHEHTARTTTQN
jgi:hypothetical protein